MRTATGPGGEQHQAASVPDPEPAGPVRRGALSPSRASDFMQCPLLYRFRVLDRIPEAPSPAAVRGTVVHAVLERLFDLPPAERTAPAARAMVAGQWESLREREPQLAGLFDETSPTAAAELASWLRSAEELLERYFELEDPTRLQPAERELRVEALLEDGLVLRGIVDRLDVAPGGELRVVDYKTGRAPSELFEAKALFQMRFYALVIWRLRGVVPRQLQLVYLGSGDVLRHTPDEAQLLATERKVRAVWAAIERATAAGDWRPSPGKLCKWCDHQVRCPAFGGTPPPRPPGAVPLPVVAPAAAGGPDPA
ncbi:PD-(D/E)XK nuclease family protein [Kineococcus glutinatus]|uniref:RecB family exonuclease n=1 Tax=Kineococcus glutinatus TaxID=1070872 RepID=A0ABP9HIC1_9ACTN